MHTSSKSTSSASFIFFVWILKISNRPVASGIPMSISLSKRPNRRNAPSMLFGRLVAAITITWELCFMPSINVNSCDTIRLSTSPCVYKSRKNIISISTCDLRENIEFNFTNLFTFRRDSIQFIDEYNCRRIFLSFLKRLPQITFRFTSQLAHNFRTYTRKEETFKSYFLFNQKSRL